MSKILVTGGCGYIGSHTMVDLINNGYQIISVDNLVNSKRKVLESVREITGVLIENYEVDLCDKIALSKVFAAHLRIYM